MLMMMLMMLMLMLMMMMIYNCYLIYLGVSIVAAVQVVALNMVYNQFAVDLNDAENHRSVVMKMMMVIMMVMIMIMIINNTIKTLHIVHNIIYRRETDHEDSLIAKLFVFTFINSYASLFYIAFVKTLVGQRLEGN